MLLRMPIHEAWPPCRHFGAMPSLLQASTALRRCKAEDAAASLAENHFTRGKRVLPEIQTESATAAYYLRLPNASARRYIISFVIPQDQNLFIVTSDPNT